MCCRRCVNKIKKQLGELDGVESVEIDLQEKRGVIVGDISASNIVQEIQMLGMYSFGFLITHVTNTHVIRF